MQMRDFLQCVKNNDINIDYMQKTKDEWKRFMDGKSVNTDIVPEEVYASWKRSKSYGADPIGNGPYLLDDSRSNELSTFRQMSRKYSNYFNQIEEIINKEFYLLIFDKNGKSGRLVDLLGICPKQTIGFDCSEHTIGTSAVAIALKEDRPALVMQHQHYQVQNQIFSCAAAPIHNNKNELIGVFNLLFYDIHQCTKAYYLVKYLTKAFDIFYSMITDEYETQLNQIIELLPQGIAYVNEKNAVKYYNGKLLDILQINREQDIQQQLKRYIPKLGNGIAFDKKDIRIDINDNPTEIHVIHQPIKSSQVNRLIIVEKNSKLEEYPYKAESLHKLHAFNDIIGQNHALQEAKAISMKVAQTSVPVLIWGENGTGKEMFAQAIHLSSQRKDKPFVAINCGAIPADIVESELFGYEEGSFTGAMKGGKIGKIEAASGGSLFLDEIESMPLHVQIKLLRILSIGKILKVGGIKELPVDLRIIAATKKDLLQAADSGLFREDLYFRISTFIIKLPALRERRDDIQLLAKYFINKISDKYALNNIKIDNQFLNALNFYFWRGNVRELEHAIERAIILMGAEQLLTVQHLPEKIQKAYQYKSIKELIETTVEKNKKKQGLLAIAEEIVIEHVLKITRGNISEAAKQLGIDRKTIYNKLQEYPKLYEKYSNHSKGSEVVSRVK